MQIAHISFGVTHPLFDEFCRTPSTKHASERIHAESPQRGRAYNLAERGYFRQRKAIKEKNQKKINKETFPPIT